MIFKVTSPKPENIFEDILTILTHCRWAQPLRWVAVLELAHSSNAVHGASGWHLVRRSRAAVHEQETNLSPSALMIYLSCAALPEPPSATLLSGT